MLAADYSAFSLNAPAAGPTPEGRIARYALSRDYHRVLRKRLNRLQARIRSETRQDAQFRQTVDTSPVQERALAEAAGLGFFGKNTCLIRPKGGSFFFLCALITDLDLEPEALPEKPWNCGACSLCLEACPTGALTEPYRLDASRCISSLTIEHRGPIQPELRPKMSTWIFGCDICQDVCPYNRNEGPALAEDFPATPAGKVTLSSILRCRSEEQFRTLFQGTPLTRPGREGLVRNGAIAAGNLRDESLIPELADCLVRDPSPLVRSHAAWALGQLDSKMARRLLIEASASEQDPAAKQEIIQALKKSI